MPTTCPQCGFAPSGSVTPSHCPRCGCEVAARPSKEAWSSIARVTNLAEVGYLADLLEGAQIGTRVRQHDDFSALDGSWQTVFILQVPEEQLAGAVELLKTHAQDLDGEEEGEWDDDRNQRMSPVVTKRWMPMLLVLMAGGLAYYAGRGGWAHPSAHHRGYRAFWRALSEFDRPLMSPADNGPQRRLRYDAAAGRMVLEDDLDGDGNIDQRRVFQAR